MMSQMRQGTIDTINESPSIVTVIRKPLKDDGDGNYVIDPFGVELVLKYRVRISHERSGTHDLNEDSAGLSTGFSLFVLTDHTCPLKEGDEFSYEGKGYRVGPVNKNKRFGEIYSSTAPLKVFTEILEV